MHHTVIKIENAVVSYREDVALHGVSLEVHDRQFIGIIGPNGAGKTTLLTLINGLGKLVHGYVEVLGYRVTRGNGHMLRKKVGYISQLQNIDPRMPITVREVVQIGRFGKLGLFHSLNRHDVEITEEFLNLVGMSALADRPIGHLSGGEQQKVAIARCLAQEPEIFLLDEPTASLDWRSKTEILDLVKYINTSRNLTTLFVTHDLSCLPTTCDLIVMMKDGKIWGSGKPDEMLTDENLSQLFDLPLHEVKQRREINVATF